MTHFISFADSNPKFYERANDANAMQLKCENVGFSLLEFMNDIFTIILPVDRMTKSPVPNFQQRYVMNGRIS